MERVQKVRIIWKVNSEESEQSEGLQYSRQPAAWRGRCCGARAAQETLADRPGRIITMVTFIKLY